LEEKRLTLRRTDLISDIEAERLSLWRNVYMRSRLFIGLLYGVYSYSQCCNFEVNVVVVVVAI
jgi:hypothetical protein